MTPVSNLTYSSRTSSGTSSSLCKRALKRVLGGLERVFPSSLRERGVSEVHTLGHSYGYWVLREVKSLMQGCPCSDLCLMFAVQRGFQPVDREFQSGLVKAFLRLHPPPLVDVSGD